MPRHVAPVRHLALTTTQRNTLSPATGSTIFNTTTGQIETYDGAAWVGINGATVLQSVISGGSTYHRTSVEFLNGSGMAAPTVTDDSVNDKIQITFATTGASSAIGKGGVRYGLVTGDFVQNLPRAEIQNQVSILANQRVTVVQIPLLAGDVVASLSFWAGTTGAATPVHQYFALYDLAGARLAISADDTTTAWSPNTKKKLAMTAAYTVPTTGDYYATILVGATTVPTLLGVGGTANVQAATPMVAASADSGTTTIPTTLGTFSGLTNTPWCSAA